MCGITGIAFSRNKEGLDSIREMTHSLTHRGPDDSGTWLSMQHGVALGHSRLSIIDLSSQGSQPMISRDRRYVIVFNGEIYNFRILLSELRDLGIQFKGHSDTEVLLEAIAFWGLDVTLQKCIGMFAFALWDCKHEEIYLVRDRFGEKPLFYRWHNNELIFASELKAIHKAKGETLHIDRDALQQYMLFGYIPSPLSIYETVKKVKPGTYIKFDSNKLLCEKSYWSARDVAVCSLNNQIQIPFSEAKDRLNILLSDAISQQSIADVQIGSFLSGGIDSSLVTALMQKQSSQRVKTFSIGFTNKSFNEAHYAKEIAKHLQTEHTELYLNTKDLLDIIPSLPTIYDEPLADYSQIPTFLVSKLARQSVTVCLSGDGGDELFGGYNHYFLAQKLWKYIQRSPKPLAKSIARVLNLFPGSKFSKLCMLFKSANNMDSFYKQLQVSSPDSSALVLGSECKFDLFDTNILPGNNIIQNGMLLDTQSFLPDSILAKVDRAAMAVSLETRIPLLDHRVFEFAWSLPFDYKVSDSSGKQILRQLLYDFVPKKLLDRPKRGFSVPMADWLRGPLKDWAESLLHPNQISNQGFLNPDLVNKLWKQHLSGRYDWKQILWNILMFQMWLNKG